jgi:polyferredoxin
MRHLELTRAAPVKWLLLSRWPQLMVRAIALGGFVFAILAGLVGTPVGSRNFSIIVVWIAWWALLMLVAVPLLGRGWCNICPIPMPGEWLQNRAVLGPPASVPRSRGRRRWPGALRNIWLQNAAFVLMALFSTVILTQPKVTALVLAGLLLVAVATALVFERRAFCRHLCPVGGFIGLYSELAPVELRVRDTAVCAGHREKTCYTGSSDGFGCPWNVFPGALTKNTNCGLCMECLRTCPLDNVIVRARGLGADLTQTRGRGMDEAFKAFIMLGSAVVYSAVLLGPWGDLKAAAYAVGSPAWWGYALSFVVVVLGVVPGLFAVAVWIGNRFAQSTVPVRTQVTRFASALIPLGLAAWIAFSLSFVFANVSYLWPVLSDPMGRGWDLLGTAGWSWSPYFTGAVPGLQAIVLLGGLGWAAAATQGLVTKRAGASRPAFRIAPVVLFHLLVTGGLLWLLVG